MRTVLVTKKYYDENGRLLKVDKPIKTDLDMLGLDDRKGTKQSWNFLGYIWDYRCGQTNKGYRINKTILIPKDRSSIEVSELQY